MKINITGFPLSIHEWWKTRKFRGFGSPVIFKNDVKNFFDNGLAKRGVKKFWLVLFENTQYDANNYLLNYLKRKAISVKLVSKYESQLGGSTRYSLFEIKI